MQKGLSFIDLFGKKIDKFFLYKLIVHLARMLDNFAAKFLRKKPLKENIYIDF